MDEFDWGGLFQSAVSTATSAAGSYLTQKNQAKPAPVPTVTVPVAAPTPSPAGAATTQSAVNATTLALIGGALVLVFLIARKG